MQVINATKGNKKRLISIMLDRGGMIEIAPGEVSNVFTPTVNTIKAAINSGTPEEVGIILGGSWEQSVASQVTGGHPYYYTNEQEAKDRLLANYDYSQDNHKTEKIVTDNSKVIDNLKKEIEDLNKKLDEYKAKDSDYHINQLDLEKTKKQLEEASIKVKELTAENEGLNNDLKTSKAKVEELEATNNKLTNDLKLTNDTIADQDKKIANMREAFNDVCDQFNIKFDETKGWYIESESKPESES